MNNTIQWRPADKTAGWTGGLLQEVILRYGVEDKTAVYFVAPVDEFLWTMWVRKERVEVHYTTGDKTVTGCGFFESFDVSYSRGEASRMGATVVLDEARIKA